MTFRFMPFLAVALLAAAGCSSERGGTAASRTASWQLKLGDGTVSTYAELDRAGAPTAIGVVWSSTALQGLPPDSDQHRCVGRTKDGTVDANTKCQHTHEFVIPLPDEVARRADIPFKWVLLNWNPVGHIPPGIYDTPHFDVHFEMGPIAEAFAIESGPCGPELVRCDQFVTARKPLAPNYMPPDYVDVEAVVPVMGNHLIDVTGPEFRKEPFTRSWIYGVYDGKVIFYEAMVTRDYLLGRPNGCLPIKTPKAV
ncbi:MAG TPA: hypothetical protein VFF44_08060, partial [Casimicrobiaceae bacterium]|nr:hypothetical protein [Casimicrobiaceae bacterium]